MLEFKSLVDKIIGDAEINKRDFINKAKEESKKIISKKIDEANDLKESILKKAYIDGNELRERIISKSELKIKNKKLEKKRMILKEIFMESLDELLKLDLSKFKDYLICVLNNIDLIGEYELIISTHYYEHAQEILNMINSKVNKKFNVKKIKPSNLIKGGFILEKDNVFINYSFEVLIDSIIDEIEFEVSNLLFS